MKHSLRDAYEGLQKLPHQVERRLRDLTQRLRKQEASFTQTLESDHAVFGPPDLLLIRSCLNPSGLSSRNTDSLEVESPQPQGSE